MQVKVCMTPALQQDNLLICFHIILVGLVSSGRKIQDVFSGSVHSVESPEATHVDCVQTGWCVRLWGRVSRMRMEQRLHGHRFY